MSKQILVGCDIYDESVETMENMGYKVLKMPKNPSIEAEISSHPDMSCVKINDIWFIDRQIEYMFEAEQGKKIIDREVTERNLKYPENIEFNCAPVGDKLICNQKYTNIEILTYANENSMTIINTKQGYAKCSTCIVSGNAIITEDESIHKSAVKHGIDILIINKGYVLLDGYEYGFIGGCSGLVEGRLLFNGTIKNHPDCDLIHKFCQKHDVEVVELCNKPLYDIGSILEI